MNFNDLVRECQVGYEVLESLSFFSVTCVKQADESLQRVGNQVGQVAERQLPHWQSRKEPLDTVSSRHLMMTNVSLSVALPSHKQLPSLFTDKHAWPLSVPLFVA